MKCDRWTIAALTLVACVTLAWPGDIHWGGDQLQLIGRALDLNTAHQLATHGLWGSKGVEYGPTPVWFYQALLLITHRPIALVLIHAAIMLVVTIWALLWLARLLKIDAMWVALVLASPHWLFYGRWLWDNTMCIPLSCVLLAAWIDFSRTPAIKTFVLVLLCMAVLPTIHPMSLPLCIAVGLDLLVHPRQWLKYLPLALGIAGLSVVAYWRYIQHVRGGAGVTVGHAMTLAAWWYPLLGARVLGGWRLSTYFFTPQWQQAYLGYGGMLLVAGGLVLIALSWAGIGRLIASPGDRRTRTVLLSTLVAMIVISGLTSAAEFPHYFNGVWPVFAVFVWEGLRLLRADRRPVVAGLFAVNLAITVSLVIALHISGGARDIYGPTLANQIEIVQELRRSHPQDLDVQVPHLKQYPEALTLLNRLLPEDISTGPTFSRAVILLDSPDSPAGWAHVVNQR